MQRAFGGEAAARRDVGVGNCQELRRASYAKSVNYALAHNVASQGGALSTWAAPVWSVDSASGISALARPARAKSLVFVSRFLCLVGWDL